MTSKESNPGQLPGRIYLQLKADGEIKIAGDFTFELDLPRAPNVPPTEDDDGKQLSDYEILQPFLNRKDDFDPEQTKQNQWVRSV